MTVDKKHIENLSGTMRRLLTWVFLASCFAQACFAETVKVENVRFQFNGKRVVIMYDFVPDEAPTQAPTGQGGESNTPALRAASSGAYKVSVFLRKESDPHFSYMPTQVSGDIGVGNFIGKDRKIVWDIEHEFPTGLPGKDYYFEIRAEPAVKKSAVSAVLLAGAGAALLAGSVATYFIFFNNPAKQSTGNFPPPPGRPK
ncbi:MAG: hypothetical protein KGJ59_03535 [Bacteroidota bacterium]|nr:hypothetical protein [Bacteroidota bacterium]